MSCSSIMPYLLSLVINLFSLAISRFCRSLSIAILKPYQIIWWWARTNTSRHRCHQFSQYTCLMSHPSFCNSVPVPILPPFVAALMLPYSPPLRSRIASLFCIGSPLLPPNLLLHIFLPPNRLIPFILQTDRNKHQELCSWVHLWPLGHQRGPRRPLQYIKPDARI
jgi:hypothetical protein